MNVIDAGGKQDLTIPEGQKIAILCENSTAIVFFSTFPNSPVTYYEQSRITNDNVELGTFTGDKKIRIEAQNGPVIYDIAVAPSITTLHDDVEIEGTATLDNAPVAATDATNKAYVDAGIAAEDLWDRTATTLSPKNAGDDVNLGTGDLIATDLTSSNKTLGSVLFAGAGGLVSEDNAELFWDGTLKNLGVGTNTPGEKLEVAGTIKSGLSGTDGLTVLNNASDVETVRLDTNGSSFLLGGKTGFGISTPARQVHIEEETALTNTVNYNLRLTMTSSDVPAAEIGVGMEFEQETSAANKEILGTFECVANSVGVGTEDGKFVWKLMKGGAAAAEVMSLNQDGNLTVLAEIDAQGGGITNTLGGLNLTAADGQNISISPVGIGDFVVATNLIYGDTSEGNVGIGTSSPNADSILDLTSTTQAFLPPRMTTAQRGGITPVNGMMIFNETTVQIEAYKNAWLAL